MNEARKETLNSERIKIERRHGNHMSYFVDSNGLLKGEWGGFHELNDCGPHGEALYELFYNRYMRTITINEYGLFYSLFSCKKYDGVLKLYDDLYICEKNERFGLINQNEKSVLHTCYNQIICVNSTKKIFIVSTETGQFLFNYQLNIESDVFDELYSSRSGYFVYKMDDSYGLLNNKGEIIIRASPEYILNPLYASDDIPLNIILQDIPFGILIKNDMFYGKIPISKYDLCLKVGHDIYENFYITIKGSKYGLLNWKCECVTVPKYDQVLLFKPKSFAEARRVAYKDAQGKSIDVILIICKEKNTYTLYNLQDCKCIISGCEKMSYKMSNEKDVIINFVKDGVQGYVTSIGTIIFSNDYDSIKVTRYNYIVSKDGKFGALDAGGEVIAPCIFDHIECNRRGELVAMNNGEKVILNPIPYYEEDWELVNEPPTYGRYTGTYAQDVMGYSDDDIDTIFDGDPSAYWNID